MAVDETLLESAIERGTATLRVYRWAVPTVSLGYFQSADDPVLSERFAGLAQVRRLSGGGAILHDEEVTYSIACPADHRLVINPADLYDAVHGGLVELLRRWGVPATLRGSAQSGEQPFLCFGRGDARDVVLGGFKIVGSAQRRRKGAVLQHGALLLRRSPYAPEFPGLFDLAPESIHTVGEVVDAVAEAISGALKEETAAQGLSDAEHLWAEHLATSRYAATAPFATRSRTHL
jgi:lipoate-protein ligase A